MHMCIHRFFMYELHAFQYLAFLVISDSVLILQPAITGIAHAAIGCMGKENMYTIYMSALIFGTMHITKNFRWTKFYPTCMYMYLPSH